MAKVLRVTRHSEMSSEQADALQAAATKLVGRPCLCLCGYCGAEPDKDGRCGCGESADSMTMQVVEQAEHDVVVYDQTVKDAAEVLALASQYGAAVVEAVLPPAILADLTNPRVNTLGIPVIRAQMDRQVDESCNATFTFNHYEKVIKVEVVVDAL